MPCLSLAADIQITFLLLLKREYKKELCCVTSHDSRDLADEERQNSDSISCWAVASLQLDLPVMGYICLEKDSVINQQLITIGKCEVRAKTTNK